MARLSSDVRAQGRVDLMRREQSNRWDIESTRFHDPNVVSCEIVTGHTRTLLVSVYLPPSTLEHLLNFEEKIQIFKGLDPIFLGSFNVDLDNTQSLCSQFMVDLLTDFSIINLVRHSRQLCRFQDLKT